jgi:zinc protease
MHFRRFAAAVCAVAILAWTTAIPVRAGAPAAGSNPVVPAHVRTLANGLRVVVLEDHAAPVAVVNMWYRFGSAYESPGKTGLAHALEHMMFRGTSDMSASGIDDWGARLGASVNAQTTTEFTRFDLVLPADRVDTALHFEAERMHDLKLAAADWNKERGAVLQEWAQDHSNPFFELSTGLQEKLYPGSALGSTALGAKADIEHATVADLRAYYHTWYVPNNATLVVSGDVDADAVFASAQKWFGAIASRPVPSVTLKQPKAATGVTLRTKAEYPFTVVDLAYAAPPSAGATEDDSLRAVIALIALQNARGPFRTALVDSGITLGFGLVPMMDRHVATFHAFLVVAPGHTAEQATRAFRTVVAESLAKGIDPDFIEAAKRSALTGLVYSKDSIAGLAGALGSAYVFPGDRDPSTFAAQIDAVMPEQVNAVARGVFASPNAAAVLEPTTTDPTKAKAPSDLDSAVKDDFGGRVPDGPLVQPAWMRADLARPLALRSRVAPVETTLPNGLRLLVQRVKDNPTVFISGAMRRSATFEPAGKDGVAALASALMSYGSARYDYAAQHRLGDDLGASISFGSSFGAHGLARDFDALLAALADDVQRPRLPEDRFVLIKEQNVTTVQRRGIDPHYRASRAFAEALYPAGDPALRESTRETLSSIGIDDVRAFARKYDRPDLTTLVVVGDVDPDAVKASVTRAFGGWAANGPAPDPRLGPIPLPSPVRKLVETAAEDVSVELGQPAPADGAKDADAFLLADALLDDQSFASRLFREVREKRGLVYSIGTTYSSGRDRGTWTAHFRAVPSKVDAAEALVRDEVKRLQNELVDPEELRRCATRQAARALLAEQSTATILGDLMHIGSERLATDYYATLADRYAHVTPDDVRRAAREYFHPDSLVEVRTGPKS